MDSQQNNQANNSQPADSSAKDWFNEINTPPAAATPPPQSSLKKRGLVVALSVGIIVLLGAAVGAMLLSSQPVAAACLTPAQYKEFAGTDPVEDALDPREHFFSESIYFNDLTSEYVDATKDETTKLVQRVGEFYQQHSPASSIVVTLSTDYVEGETSAELAQQRNARLKSELIKAGVAEAAIVVDTSVSVAPEEDGEWEDLPAVLSITSATECREV